METMKMTAPFDAAYIRERLKYEPETGLLFWLPCEAKGAKWNRTFAGKATGSPTALGYLRVRLDGRLIYVHRLAWVYMTGEWPSARIDHKDRDVGNNRWANLRPATAAENMVNSGPLRTNKLGVRGVWESQWGFHAEIRRAGVKYHLGTFRTAHDAGDAYDRARSDLYGEFAPT